MCKREGHKGYRIFLLLVASIGYPLYSHADDVGDSISNLSGSNEFLVNSGNAIRVTCRGLAGLGTGRSASQTVLFGACGDMVNQAFFLHPTNPGTQDRYSLGADGSEEYFGLLRQFSGEELSSQGRNSTDSVSGEFDGIGARLSAIRQGTRTSGLAFNLQGVDLMSLHTQGDEQAIMPMVGGSAGSADADSGFAWFGTVDYGFGDRDGTDFENGYDSSSYGITLGLDYAYNNGVVLGAAVSIFESEVDFDNERSGSLQSISGGEIETDLTSLSIFVNYAGESFYTSGILSFGQTDYDLERSIDVIASSTLPSFATSLSSDTESDQLAGEIQFGYSFGETATSYDLYGGVDFLQIDIDGYTEEGSPLALQYGDQDVDSTQLFIGGTVRRAYNTDNGVIVPYLTLEYRHEFENDSRAVDARYALGVSGFTNAGGETDNFRTPTDDPDEDFFEVSVGISGQLANSIALFLQYTAVAGLEDTSSNLVTVGIRGTF